MVPPVLGEPQEAPLVLGPRARRARLERLAAPGLRGGLQERRGVQELRVQWVPRVMQEPSVPRVLQGRLAPRVQLAP